MAVHVPITGRREFLALIGNPPLAPAIIEMHPASFSSALAQYRRLCGERFAINPVDETSEEAGDLVDQAVIEALDGLLMAPAQGLSDVAEKLTALSREYAFGDIPVEHLSPVIADIFRLGGAA